MNSSAAILLSPAPPPLGIAHRRKKRFHRAGQAFLDLLQEPPAGWTPSAAAD